MPARCAIAARFPPTLGSAAPQNILLRQETVFHLCYWGPKQRLFEAHKQTHAISFNLKAYFRPRVAELSELARATNVNRHLQT